MTFNLEILGTNGYGKIFLLDKICLNFNDIPSLNYFINDISNMSFLIIEQKGGFQTLILPLYNESLVNNFEKYEINQLNMIIDNLYLIKNELVFNTNIFSKLKELNSLENTLFINKNSFKTNLLKHFIYLHNNVDKYKKFYDFLRNKETIDLYDFNLREFNGLYEKYVNNQNLNILDSFNNNDYYKLFFKSRFIFFDKKGEIINIPLYLNEGIIKSNTNFLRSIEDMEYYNQMIINEKNEKKKFINKFVNFFTKKKNSD